MSQLYALLTNSRLYIIIGTLFLLSIAGLWQYNKFMQEHIARLQADAVLVEEALNRSVAEVKRMQQDLGRAVTEFKIASAEMKTAQERVDTLAKKLREHDLGALAEAKPELVERRIRKASEDVKRCFEILSGSSLTEEERNATKPSEINSTCSDIANPKYTAK